MRLFRAPAAWFLTLLVIGGVHAAETPVTVTPVTGRHGMVVAGHPEATQAGVAALQAGGNAVDAAVAVSLSLGVAEPYGSGLGGKLMLLYYEAATGRTYAVEAMDAAGSLNVDTYKVRPEEDRSYGYGSVCVPGLAAGLWTAHQKWGKLKWADNVAPAARLAREGFEILPKTHDFFAEQEKKLRRGDPEIARLYLPGGRLPVAGSRLPNADLASTLELLAQRGRDGFYRGPVAEAIVAASQRGGGVLTLDDLATYEARVVEPLQLDFRGFRLLASPPPTNGAPLFLAIMKVLEDETFAGPLRAPVNLDKIGRVWREVQPLVQAGIADVPQAAFNFEKLVAPDSIAAIRAKVRAAEPAARKVADAEGGARAPRGLNLRGAQVPPQAPFDDSGSSENLAAATTHFVVADSSGNIVCATQSQSLHFGAGVVPPGTGVVLNDSMSNFAYSDPAGVNYAAAGKRPRSTISPTIVFRGGKPAFAIGIPGAARIPTALLQALLDRLVLDRPLAAAIGDTRIHWDNNWRTNEQAINAELSYAVADVQALQALGWKVERPEAAGTGRYFGGFNAIEVNADGSYTGYADPRRTNTAAGY